ncbi:MAG: hypothetical protein RLZZ352_953 [Pseudomonadota bacterium]|jgi:hypothetical protein
MSVLGAWVRSRLLVHGGTDGEPYPVGDGVMAVGLRDLSQRLAHGLRL